MKRIDLLVFSPQEIRHSIFYINIRYITFALFVFIVIFYKLVRYYLYTLDLFMLSLNILLARATNVHKILAKESSTSDINTYIVTSV